MRILQSEIKKISLRILQRGWSDASSGNFSLRLNFPYSAAYKKIEEKSFHQSGQLSFFISASGSRWEDIYTHPEDNMVAGRLEDNKLNFYGTSSNIHPSSEYLTHVLVMLSCPETKALLHVHPVEAIAITHDKNLCSARSLSRIIHRMQPESVVFLPEGVGFVKYSEPGSINLAMHTAEAFQKYPVVFWEKHGILAKGENLTQAFDRIDICIKSMKIYFQCKMAGIEPEGLSESQIEKLKQSLKYPAQNPDSPNL